MQLDQVTLAVRDLDRSIRFYVEAIGLDLLGRDADRATLGHDGQARLGLVERPRAAPRGDDAGLFHMAWLLADRMHLGAALRRLQEQGVKLTGAADHHVSEAVYLDDPDGHGIELYADRDRATWHRDGRLVLTNDRLDLAGLVAAADAAGIAPRASANGLRLGHLHLEAVDLAASSRFAVEALGLERMATWPHAHFLAWDGYHHHLAYNDWARRRRPLDAAAGRIGLLEIAIGGTGGRQTLTDPNGISFSRG